MSKAEGTDYTKFVLPNTVVSRADILRLVREFETVDNTLTAQSVRKKVGATDDLSPIFSPQLTDFLDQNPVDLNNSSARSAYIKQLRLLKNSVHIMNMTFAVVADPESLQKLIAWVRESVHSQTVIEVHFQPALVAGVYIRSENHVFDFSVRNALSSKRDVLRKELEALRG